MESVISLSSTTSIPAYLVNFTSQPFVTSVQANSSRPSQLTLSGETTSKPGFESMAAAAPIGRGASGTWNVQAGSVPSATGTGVAGTASAGVGTTGEEEDVFGEHYFHICIYIWVFVVVSSLIALSVKWGCCGRSLTRWEVKKLPLRKFHRTEGDECHDKCPICHESFHEGRLIRQLPCNHCYHSYCVDRWLVKMSNRCPLCKQRVSISLFCPWSKDRRNKEAGSGLSGSGCPERFGIAELDTEAPVDEAPPVPPLSTLTPNSWYGEDIMSGPSKFVIMRPGRPTRVIDVREQSKSSKVSGEGCEELESAVEEGSFIRCSGEDKGSSPTSRSHGHLGPALAKGQDSPGAVMSAPSSSPSLCDHNHCSYHHHHIEQHQHHHVLDELHKSPRSNRSSRSCSVSSDLPLLSSTSAGQCQACGEGREDGGFQCLCQARREENIKGLTGPHTSIPLATTKISATPELSRCQMARKTSTPGTVRHLQVISLHNQEPVPCPSMQQKFGDKSDSATGCACGVDSSVPSRPLSVSDETTVCLSSGSSSVLTSSGASRSSDRVTTSRLSLPQQLACHNSNPSHSDHTEITSMSLDTLPGHLNPSLSHLCHTVIETPITYLGSDVTVEKNSKHMHHKECKESRRKEANCSVEAIAPLSCRGLLPPQLLEKHHNPFSNLDSANLSDTHWATVEYGPNDLKMGPIYKTREPREAWQKEPSIQSLPSDPAYQFDPALTSLPASPPLYTERSPPPPPRRTHRRSNDYTCKHL